MSEFKSNVSSLTPTHRQYWRALQREFGAGDLPVLLRLDEHASSAPGIFLNLRNLGLIETERRGRQGIELIWVCRDEKDWQTHLKRRDALALQLPVEKRQGFFTLGAAEILYWMELRRMAEKQPLPLTFRLINTSNPASGHFCLHRLRKAGLIETTKAGRKGVWLLWICDQGDFWKPAVKGIFKHAQKMQPPVIVPAALDSQPRKMALHQLESMTPEQWERYQRIANPQGQRRTA